MTGVPVETVVELLMHHSQFRERCSPFDEWSIELAPGNRIYADTEDELRAKVHDYVETLREDGE